MNKETIFIKLIKKIGVTNIDKFKELDITTIDSLAELKLKDIVKLKGDIKKFTTKSTIKSLKDKYE